MKLANKNPLKLETWKKLEDHFKETKNTRIDEYFKKNIHRAEQMSCSWKDFFIDYSKNRINKKSLMLLKDLAIESKLPDAIKAYFSGVQINKTEKRAVLHTALRNFSDDKFIVDDKDIMPDIRSVRARMEEFTNKVISGEWKGFSGKPITHVVNIGIGGSDLGPSMVCEALSFYKNHINSYFISNVEGDHVREILKKCPFESTLFIIVSKTFKTQETISNANTVKKWFLKSTSQNSISKHFIAISNIIL